MICGATYLQAADETPAPVQPKPLTLAIGRITVNPSVIDAVKSTGDDNSLARVIEGMEVQLRDAIVSTGKFQIVERNADSMKSVQEEHALISSGLVDKTKPGTAQIGEFTGANYIIVTQVTDYQDFTKKQESEGTGTTAVLRKIRMEMSSWIIDTATTEVLQTSTFQLEAKDLQQLRDSIETSDGTTSDRLYSVLGKDLARHVVRDIVYKQFPPRVLAKTGDVVTIQIGKGTGAKKGEKWDIFALGKNLKDPDTGKNLGPEEIYIGQVELTRVNPDKSQAKPIEDNGIDAGAIARPSESEEKEDK
jgi:curli biogenesis system outer membrane secretion channel CsgG